MRGRKVLGSGLVAALAVAGMARAEDFRVEKKFDLAAGGSFMLRSEAGDVEVHGVDGGQATIVVTSTRTDFAELYDLRFEPTGGDRLDVTIERKSHLRWPSDWRSRTHVAVTLPRQVAADIHSSGGGVEVTGLAAKLKVSSSGGGVDVSGIQGDVVLSSSGGGVEVRDVEGTLRLDSSGGGVAAHNIGGDIDASSSGGGVRIEEARGAVIAESSGGPVRVTFAAGNTHGGDLSSSGGGVEARVDPKVGLEIDAHSSGGGLTCDVPITVQGKLSRDTVRGRLNGGGALLKIRSSGGGVSIEER
jgi:hypothetical protein